MNTVLLAVIALGVIYLCISQPIPDGTQRRPWLSQWVYLYKRRRHGR